MRTWIPLCLIPLFLALATTMPTWGAETGEHFGDPRFPMAPIIDMVGAGRYRILPPPFGVSDPIAALGDGDAAMLTGKHDTKAINAYIDRYVDRIAESSTANTPADLTAWLAENPMTRRSFWLALSPNYDDIPAAITVLDTLRQSDPKVAARYGQLAVAMAVVHDTPDAVLGSRYTAIWGVDVPQFNTPPTYQELFAYFTDPKLQAVCPFKSDTLSWSMMVHLVDLDADAEQRAWALKNMAAQRTDVGALYPMVPYDDVKLQTKEKTKLGNRPYSLVNLLNIGGVCGDQGHFTSRVAKSFGIPSMKCTGYGRYGGIGHAWAGFLAAQGRRPILEFTGRYQFDYYYTGDIFDPQTRTNTLDRYVALSYDGASLSFLKMEEATCLARAARACYDSNPEASLVLAQEAVDRNTYCADAWRVLMTHVADGHVPAKDAKKLGSRMLKDLKAHPDLTIECLALFLRSIPMDDQKDRQSLWNGAYALYGERPDLQIALRMAQCAELVSVGQEPVALQRALETVVPNSKEGALILPLAEFVVTSAKDFAAKNSSFHLEVVQKALQQADKDFPKTRGSSPSESYATFAGLIRQLQ